MAIFNSYVSLISLPEGNKESQPRNGQFPIQKIMWIPIQFANGCPWGAQFPLKSHDLGTGGGPSLQAFFSKMAIVPNNSSTSHPFLNGIKRLLAGHPT